MFPNKVNETRYIALFVARESMKKLFSINCPNDCNWTRTHNHLVHKRTLNHLAKFG